jgi:hypothetical protein
MLDPRLRGDDRSEAGMTGVELGDDKSEAGMTGVELGDDKRGDWE